MLWLSVANKDEYIIYCLLFTYSALSVTYLPPHGATVHALIRKSVKNWGVSRPVVLSVPGEACIRRQLVMRPTASIWVTSWLTNGRHVHGFWEASEQQFEYFTSVSVVGRRCRRRVSEANTSLPYVLTAVYCRHVLRVILTHIHTSFTFTLSHVPLKAKWKWNKMISSTLLRTYVHRQETNIWCYL